MMTYGSCECRRVKFSITGGVNNIVYCHCSQCRKSQGSAFATNGNVNITDFIFISGENDLTDFESSPGKRRWFCKHCGSPIYSCLDSVPSVVRVRLGTLDAFTKHPGAHIYVASKAHWYEINDALPRYPEREPR